MLFPADLATADLAVLEAATPAVHREEYRKTVAAGNRATVTHTDSLGREAATTYTSHSGEVTTYHYDDSHRTTRWTDSDGTVSHTGAVMRYGR